MNKKLIFAALLLSAAFGGDIEISDAYARTSMPGVLNSAAFMTIKNNSDKDVNLIAANTDKSDVTELHTHINENGMMKMQKVDFIKIPAKSQSVLKPGSDHIMLMNLPTPIKEGDEIAINLKFDNNENLNISVKAKDIKKMMNHKKH